MLLHTVREPLRWQWYRSQHGKKTRLQLITPRGVIWDFKMSGGSWLRKTTLKLSDHPS